MWQVFLLIFRESLESILILAVILGFLKKVNGGQFKTAIFSSLPFSIGASFLLGGTLLKYTDLPYIEGICSIVVGLLIVAMLISIYSSKESSSEYLRKKLHYLCQGGRTYLSSWILLFLFSFLMIFREGVEISFIIVSIFHKIGFGEMLFSAFCGVFSSVFLFCLFLKFSNKIPLFTFLKAKNIFLILFSIEMLFYGFHELTEINFFPGIDNEYWHFVTEIYGPEGPYAIFYLLFILSVSLLPLLFSKNK